MLNLQINALKPNSFAYIHSITQYGIFFGGNGCSNSSNSGNIFTLEKKIIRIMAGTRPRTPCKNSVLKMRYFYPLHENVYFH
jgi:hypothetical protein